MTTELKNPADVMVKWTVTKINPEDGSEVEIMFHVAEEHLEPQYYRKGTIRGGMLFGEEFELNNPFFVYRFTPTATCDLPRALYAIAREITADWKNVYFGARPYLDAMHTLTTMDDCYGMDSAHSIVSYFLANAGTWRGEVARRVKKELKSMLKRSK